MAKRKSSTRSKKKSGRKSTSRKRQPAATRISPERRLDLLGIVLLLIGLLTALSLLSANRSAVVASWIGFLGRAFGWGAYLFPLTLLLIGIGLLLRNYQQLPPMGVERLLGLLLLFFNLLVWLHWLAGPETKEIAYELASQGEGGGYLGAVLVVFLRSGLGSWGMAVVLVAWLLVALALTFDVAVLDLFRWVRPLRLRLVDWWDERRAARQEAAAARRATHAPSLSTAPVTQTSPPAERPASDQPAPNAAFPEAVESQGAAWELPQVTEMLDVGMTLAPDEQFDQQRGQVIEETLASFGAPAKVVEINRGPVITQFGVEPDFVESRGGRTRVRVGKIASLADDLALALAASRIRVQAPVPGKGYVGIEVPNEQIAVVALRDVIESPAFRGLNSPLRFALGQDVAGNAVAADLAAMPHMLIAGATGSGKSVCVNALICCLLLHNTPETLRLVMIDPKRVELTGYNGIPHLLAPVVVELDRVVGVLQWVTHQMDQRYHKFAKQGARNIADYNRRMAENGDKPLPYLVVVIDELADLMMVAPDQTERLITRMAQLARATGIHLVISTQRPSVDVVTGLIKANIPSRISFATASGVDSRVVLDQPGAERLLGRGDMLFQAPDAPAPVRLQGVFVSDPEILRIVQYWRAFLSPETLRPSALAAPPPDAPPEHVPLKQMPIWEEIEELQEQEELDELYDQAVEIVREEERASISMLQRRLRIGYTRAARLVDSLEDRGIISPPEGPSHNREVLDYGEGDEE